MEEIDVSLLQLRCMKNHEKKCFETSTSEEKEDLVFGLIQEKMGEIDVSLLQLRCMKNHAKKCFETSTSEEKRGPCFWFGPRENGRNRREFITSQLYEKSCKKVL